MPSLTQRTFERIRDDVCQHIPAGGRVLEVSCAQGDLLKMIRDRGYEVRGTNFSRYDDADPSLEMDWGVDLLDRLPYEDGAFDGVVLADVIEHLSSHEKAIAEIARVLAPGGKLIVATPNTLRINSRLHFLFTGFFKIKRSFVAFDVSPQHAFTFHNHPPHLPVYLYQCHAHGLPFVAISTLECKPKSVLMWLLFAPVIYPVTWYKLNRSEKFLKGTPASRMLLKILTSFRMLCGETWVCVVGKPSAPVATDDQPTQTRLPAWAERS
ncbi:MAG: class I SAM-dependent methyltransferase [Planctomycetota bacterium]